MSGEKNNRQVFDMQTFGDFAITMPDGTVYHTSKKAEKLWNLFKYLLVKRHMVLTPENILDTLYPDTDFKDPKNTVKNLVYRLRKLLTAEGLCDEGIQCIEFKGGGYQLNSDLAVNLDFERFEALVDRAVESQNSNPSAAIEDYYEAMKLYKGDFMNELAYEDWIYPLRVYYSEKYVSCVSSLTSILKSQGRYSDIAGVCERAIQVEACEEEINLVLIESYIMVGRMVDARKHYAFAVQQLEKQYGLKPTKELQEIGRLLENDSYTTDNLQMDIIAGINEENKSGAFYCSNDVFMNIYELERRRKMRSKTPLCVVYVDFSEMPGAFKSTRERSYAVSDFRQILLRSLRQGDVVTMSSKTRFLIMLPQLGCDMIEMVLQRIFHKFKEDGKYEKLNLIVKEARLGE